MSQKLKRGVAKERVPKAPLQWAAKKSAPPADVVKDREESSDNEAVPDDFEEESESEVEDGAPDSGEEDAESDSSDEEASEEEATGAGPSAIPLENYSDSSEDDLENRIGDVPTSWYKEYDHIGYNVKGEKIARRTKQGDRLDAFLDAHDKSKRWTLYDPVEDKEVTLDKRDREMIRNIQKGKFADPEFDPYEVFGDPGPVSIHPMLNSDEPKRRFIPSKWEAQRVNYLVQAIKKGWIKTGKERYAKKKPALFLLWDQAGEVKPRSDHIPAPRMRPPGHSESYNPPEEYLLSKEELKAWKEADPSDRKVDFVPAKFPALRDVPGYSRLMHERFERCLDLYMAPRKLIQRQWVDDPKDLLPQLPSPSDLRPFPTRLSTTFAEHTGAVLGITTDHAGQWLASCGAEGQVYVWEVATGRLWRKWHFDPAPSSVAWAPDRTAPLLLVASGRRLLFIDPCTAGSAAKAATQKRVQTPEQKAKTNSSKWTPPPQEDIDQGVLLQITHTHSIARVAWHHKGDYFASLSPDAGAAALVIHQLSKQQSQCPFKSSKGRVEAMAFHPSRPLFFVATQRHVRMYNLSEQKLVKKLTPGVQWISSIAVHPAGDNLIIGSQDRRVCWFDLDGSEKPYRTLKYHGAAVRSVAFHPAYPLFASGGNEAGVHVFHGMVYNDLMRNPLIVPLKVLRGHGHVDGESVLDVLFHPAQPWLFTAGADGAIRLFV